MLIELFKASAGHASSCRSSNFPVFKLTNPRVGGKTPQTLSKPQSGVLAIPPHNTPALLRALFAVCLPAYMSMLPCPNKCPSLTTDSACAVDCCTSEFVCLLMINLAEKRNPIMTSGLYHFGTPRLFHPPNETMLTNFLCDCSVISAIVPVIKKIYPGLQRCYMN